MSGVDNRVVSMKFDNAEFEKKLGDTLQSLDRLKHSLDFANSTQGLNALSAASNSFSMGGMGSAVDGISGKFLALATIGITALATITSKAVSAGISLANSFTFGPITAGFREFETNMNSIQTILANTQSKGSTLDDVNGALQKLNEYSDKTIYNFSQMARNIGTFTAAGVDLNTSVDAIKGIANLAAISGSNSEQASTAMYQLSQAIAAGSVKLIDWNSVVNAGLGGEVFKSALFETGKAMGTIKNIPVGQTFAEWEKAGNSFRQSLSEDLSKTVSPIDKLNKATADSAKQVKEAEQNAAEAVVSASERVTSARESAAKSAKDSAKQIADAQKAVSASVVKSAADLKAALESAVQAQKRLDEAMKPASADELQAATDRLTIAQLDQAASANDIDQALQQQKRTTEDLAAAQLSYDKIKGNRKKNGGELQAAQRRLEDAQLRSAELAGSIERARVGQNEATRALTASELQLAEVKKKGSAEDTRVISAKEALAKAQEAIVATREANVQREVDAAQRLADVIEQTSDRQAQAQKSISDAESNLAKTRIRSQEAVARAHEAATERIKAANESATGSNNKSWLTSEVLTKTLQGFTGDLTEAQIMQLGYTKEQAAQILKLGKLGVSAATEVKTLTQLLGTIKEAVGTGWKDSFDIIIGGFGESKELFTNINNTVGKFISNSAKARNDLLQGWKDLGGRTLLIKGFSDAVKAVGSVLKPIKEAFREIFPPATAATLYKMTQNFANFTHSLIVGKDVADRIKRTFAGFFALIEIGWTIFKGILGVVRSVIGLFLPLGAGVLGVSSNFGDLLVRLNKFLVTGGKIHGFFQGISNVIDNFRSSLIKAFTSFKASDAAEASLGRVKDRFDNLMSISDRFSSAFGRVSGVFERIKIVLDEVGTAVGNWFSTLGSKLAKAFGPGDFNAAVDIVNVGLLGGIALLLRNFVKNGFKNFGGGIVQKINGILDGLTGRLQAMQANVKADTLMKIAIAVGVLTASVLILSLIDSAALTKALTAMAVGFGQLVATMAILNSVAANPRDAVKLGILAATLILLASAMVIMSIAVKILSTMGWEELAKGLLSITVMLGIFIVATKLLAGNVVGMIAAGIAMTAIAVGLILLGAAVKIFSTMSWTELAKGFVAVGVGLLLIGNAMKIMPINMPITAAGLILVGIALTILGGALKIFATMSWGEIAKGLLGVTAALLLIGNAMQVMPLTLPITAAGLILVGIALTIIGGALKVFASLSWGEMAKGLLGIAILLGVLAVGVNAMSGALAGAAALVVVSGALLILTHVLQELGKLSIAQLITGLVAIAAVMLIVAVGATALQLAIPFILGFGVALAVLGGAFALFGIGAFLVAKAFEALANAGRAGIQALIDIIKRLIMALPEFVGALIKSLAQVAADILASSALIVKLFVVLLIQILEAVIQAVPKIAEAFGVIILAALKTIRDLFPAVLATGFELLLTLLRGIRDHIAEIIALGVDIVINLATALTNNAVKLVDAGVTLLLSFLGAFVERVGDIVAAGFNILVALIKGIADNIFKIVDAAGDVIVGFIRGILDNVGKIRSAGVDAIIAFLEGLSSDTLKIITAGKDLVLNFLKGVGQNAIEFATAAADMLIGFLNALAKVIREKSPLITAAGIDVGKAIAEGMIKGLESIPVVGSAIKLAGSVLTGVTDALNIKSPSKVFMWVGRMVAKGLAIALDKDTAAENSAVAHAERIVKAFHETLTGVPGALDGVGEINPVITPVLDLTRVRLAARDLNSLMAVSAISPNASFDQARLISTTTELDAASNDVSTAPVASDVTFNQNIYAPSALSTNDIYRNTKSQIALAKEELGIL